jgi:hypothetical protein
MAGITLVIDIHFRSVRWDGLACIRASRLRLVGMGLQAMALTAGRKRPIYGRLTRRQEVSTKQRKHERAVEIGVGLGAGR